MFRGSSFRLQAITNFFASTGSNHLGRLSTGFNDPLVPLWLEGGAASPREVAAARIASSSGRSTARAS
jgi:hypothetical protein